MKIGFFESQEGEKSFIRLQSFFTFLLLLEIDTILLLWGYYKNNPIDIWFIGSNLVFLVAMFYPKYLQKFIEMGVDKAKAIKDKL